MNYLKRVKEFNKLFNHYVGKKPEFPDDDTIKLRINLILEELVELAQATWHEEWFSERMQSEISRIKQSKDEENDDKYVGDVAVLDAFCDIQYVLSGAILAFGMQNNFDAAFLEVHRSNMSKAADTKEEAILTIQEYKKNQPEEEFSFEYDESINKYLCYRVSDRKTVKSVNYSPAELKSFIH